MERKVHIPFVSFPVRIENVALMKTLTAVSVICTFYIFIVEWRTIGFMMDAFDKELMILLNFAGGLFADRFWYGYSQKIIWAPLVVVALTTLFVYKKGKISQKLLLLVSVVLMMVVLDQLSSGIIKPLTCRLRPSHTPVVCDMLHYVNNYHGGKFGFVSGHATGTMGVAVFLGMMFRDRFTRLSLACFTLLMCYSRIYLGVHYPGDVVCGALLGAGIAWLTVTLLRHFHLAISTNKRPWGLLIAYYLTVFGLVIYA
ncbi:MAG: phosphatase PAP2 family protein [Prevotella sp.]|jgi:undecaprenyl-diphosphatase